MESLEREVEQLFKDSTGHPLLLWSRWEDFVRRHQLGPRQADALLWNRMPPEPREPPEPSVADSIAAPP
ncbi:MAG: hypothetical protein ACJ8GK_06650 [Luteimonas sp.]